MFFLVTSGDVGGLELLVYHSRSNSSSVNPRLSLKSWWTCVVLLVSFHNDPHFNHFPWSSRYKSGINHDLLMTFSIFLGQVVINHDLFYLYIYITFSWLTFQLFFLLQGETTVSCRFFFGSTCCRRRRGRKPSMSCWSNWRQLGTTAVICLASGNGGLMVI